MDAAAAVAVILFYQNGYIAVSNNHNYRDDF